MPMCLNSTADLLSSQRSGGWGWHDMAQGPNLSDVVGVSGVTSSTPKTTGVTGPTVVTDILVVYKLSDMGLGPRKYALIMGNSNNFEVTTTGTEDEDQPSFSLCHTLVTNQCP